MKSPGSAEGGQRGGEDKEARQNAQDVVARLIAKQEELKTSGQSSRKRHRFNIQEEWAAIIVGSKPAGLYEPGDLTRIPKEIRDELSKQTKARGLKIVKVSLLGKEQYIIGNEQNVEAIKQLFGKYKREEDFDAEYHKVLGANLGYSEEEIADFVKSLGAKEKQEPKGTSPYEILGVEPTATIEEIKKSYRRLSMEFHPDRPGGNNEMFRRINEAYEILSDSERRKSYDDFERSMPHHSHSGSGSSWGSGKAGASKGADSTKSPSQKPSHESPKPKEPVDARTQEQKNADMEELLRKFEEERLAKKAKRDARWDKLKAERDAGERRGQEASAELARRRAELEKNRADLAAKKRAMGIAEDADPEVEHARKLKEIENDAQKGYDEIERDMRGLRNKQ